MKKSPIEVHIIPAIPHNHNYIYVLHDQEMSETAVVDPGDAEVVLNFLEEKNWQLTHILNTHHHWDHTDGNLTLKQATNCIIVGFAGDKERIKGIDIALEDAANISVCNRNWNVMHVPGHTLGAITYYSEEEGIIFTGDTLFTMGCGRIFEGNPEMMHQSLQKIAALPAETKIYSGHEYAASNAKFALSIDSENDRLKKRYQAIISNVDSGTPNQPSTIKDELATNPFLRVGDANIRSNIGMNYSRDEEVFGRLRQMKNEM